MKELTKDEKRTKLRRMIRNIILVIIICTIILVVIIDINPFWMWPSEEKTIILTDAHLDINNSEVDRINYVLSYQILEGQRFAFCIRTNQTINQSLRYWATDLEVYGITIEIHQNTTTKRSWIDVSDRRAILEKEFESEKNYLIKRTNIVASVCNITLDWGKAIWSVSYQG